MATNKPCHGCGRTEEEPFREVDKVCKGCRIDLKYAQQCRELVENKVKGEYGIYKISHNPPRYSYHTLPGAGYSSQNHEELAETFRTFLLFVADELTEFVPKRDIGIETERSRANIWIGGYMSKYPGISNIKDPDIRSIFKDAEDHNSDYVIMRKDIAEAAQKLHKGIEEAIRITARNVGESGTDLLLKVAKGEITVDQLNENSLNLKKWTEPKEGEE